MTVAWKLITFTPTEQEDKQIMLSNDIISYIENEIIPRYDHFDAAHQRDHVNMVIKQSLDIAEHLDVDLNMVYVIAAYHDTGLCEGREHHHEVSAHMMIMKTGGTRKASTSPQPNGRPLRSICEQ